MIVGHSHSVVVTQNPAGIHHEGVRTPASHITMIPAQPPSSTGNAVMCGTHLGCGARPGRAQAHEALLVLRADVHLAGVVAGRAAESGRRTRPLQ